MPTNAKPTAPPRPAQKLKLDDYLSREQAAKTLGVSDQILDFYIKSGALSVYRLPPRSHPKTGKPIESRRVLIRPEDLRKFVERE